jgi:hypothetical protein
VPGGAGGLGRLRVVTCTIAATFAALGVTALFSSGAAAAQDSARATVVVNGQPAATSSDARPAPVYATGPTNIAVSLQNLSDSTLYVGSIRFEGKVLDLPLFSYDSTVNVAVPPHTTRAVTLPLSTNGIGGLAIGLIVANVALLTPTGSTIASQNVVTKVHGSIVSLYGLFGITVLVLTVVSLVLALLALARHRLPQRRLMRAERFFVAGFGIGLVLTFTLAAASIYAPGPGHWLPLLVVPSVAGILVGLLTPAPDEEEFDDYDEDVLLAQIHVVDDDPLEAPSGDHRATSGVGAAGPGTPGPPDPRKTVGP